MDYFYTLRYSEHDPDGRDSILARFPSLTAQPLTSPELLDAHCESEVFAAEVKAFEQHCSYLEWSFKLRERTMVMNVKVYTMADKYDVLGLKKLAQARFLKAFRETSGPLWEECNMASVLHAVIQSTLSADKEIRETVVDACATNMGHITGITRYPRPEHYSSKSEEWSEVFTEDIDFNWEVLRRVAEQSKNDIKASQNKWLECASKNIDMRNNTQRLEAENMQLKDQLATYKEKTGRLLRVIGGQRCEACGSSFQLEIRTSPQDPHDFFVRCCACGWSFTGMSE